MIAEGLIGKVLRRMLVTETPGQSVIARLLAGTGITLSSTGADTGTGDVTAGVDVGTSANKIVQLNASAQLPAVSGALLTDLPASGGTPMVVFSTVGENTSRLYTNLGGGGAVSIDQGFSVVTGATGYSYANVSVKAGPATYTTMLTRKSFFSIYYASLSVGTDVDLAVVAGEVGGSITLDFTRHHYGWTVERRASGTPVCSASNAAGTRTSTDIGWLWSGNELFALKDGTTSIKYYSAGTLKATHTTNLPTDFTSGGSFSGAFGGQIAVGNVTANSNSGIKVSGMSVGHEPY